MKRNQDLDKAAESPSHKFPGASQKGDISITMSLILLAIILSSAVFFGTILSRQLRLAGDVVIAERAIYAANSALEEARYSLVKQFQTNGVSVAGNLDYTGIEGRAEFSGSAKIISVPGKPGQECVSVSGTYHGETRRLKIIPLGCDLN